MPSSDLHFDGKKIKIRRAVMSPNLKDEKILTSDLWNYIDLWLRRNNKPEAIFYWNQAREFYKASLGLPITASPLVLYYCFLNATKALLITKSITFTAKHGVTGKSSSDRAGLSNEIVKIMGGGILPSFANYYGEASGPITYNLKDIFYNLAFIHRSYCISYSTNHLFFSLKNCRYVKIDGRSEAWIAAEMESKNDDRRILSTLPPQIEKDIGITDRLEIRKSKGRLTWKSGRSNIDKNLNRLRNYHRKIRKDFTYIAGTNRWYLKRRLSGATIIDRHAPVLIFSAMHRLSELSRYEPVRLDRLLQSQRNWLLSEFIKTAPLQFLDEIACELTGQEIEVPGIHSGSLLSTS